ncbi:LysR family transcriptional regulator [uncultured Tateyamaria sp.]|uniref:LysR family transcriptional regulator n=1 Tax=uncultured Tateyamaria sp. TaxID=455651 RepID=UPI0026145D42|nr:LysR family transcriptional regulator [uncultured Tateyamaria sp.]
MTKSLPPLTWFRSFEAAARHLSFTAAAEEIGLTQSAISQQVKSLEMRLRVPLFVRQPRGLALTDHGRRLLPEIGAPLDALAAAAGKFDAGPALDLLTVATSVSVAQWVIAPNLSGFTATFPGTRLRILSAIWSDDFKSAQADVEIRFGSQKQAGADAELLQPNRLVAVKSPTLVGSLDDLPLIEAVGTSSGWRDWCEKLGHANLQPTLYADTYGMAMQLAAHGNGVALVSEVLAQHAIRTGLVEQANDATIPAAEGYFLTTPGNRAAATHFRAWFMGQLSQ